MSNQSKPHAGPTQIESACMESPSNRNRRIAGWLHRRYRINWKLLDWIDRLLRKSARVSTALERTPRAMLALSIRLPVFFREFFVSKSLLSTYQIQTGPEVQGTDIGRPFSILRRNLTIPMLGELIGSVENLQPVSANKGYVATNAGLVQSVGGALIYVARESSTIWQPDSIIRFRRKSAGPPRSRISMAILSEGQRPKLLPIEGLPEGENFQDPRVFRYGSRIGALLAKSGKLQAEKEWIQVFAELNEECTTVERTIPFSLSFLAESEKNWMPISDRNPVPTFIYSVSPTITYQLMDSTLSLVSSYAAPGPLDSARGGTNLSKIGNHLFLAVVHHTYRSPRRHYSHRAVIFEKVGEGFKVVRFSREFFLRKVMSIEFACGLDIQGRDALISFGANERTSIVARCRAGDLIDLCSLQ